MARARKLVTVVARGGVATATARIDALGCETLKATLADRDRTTRVVALADALALSLLKAAQRTGELTIERVQNQ